MKTENKPWLFNIALIVFFVLLGNLFVLSFKSGEQYIYYWDIAGYWTSGLSFTALFFSDIGAALRQLYESILFEDYTLLPVLAYVPVFRWLSRSNAAFVLTTYNVYGVPFLLMLYWFFVRILDVRTLLRRAAVLFLLFTGTVFLTPLMGGFLDACGLTVAAGILLLLSYWDMTKISPAKCLLLAGLVLVLCFLRRWYSFWAVSFFPAYFIVLAIKGGKTGLRDQSTLRIFGNLFLSGALWLVILVVFFREFLVRVLTNNFSFAYSAYDFGGIGYNLGFIAGQTGLFFILLALIGVAFSLRSEKQRQWGLFFLLQSALCLLLFTRIQSLGVQHLYLFVPALCYFSVSAALALPGVFSQKAVRVAVAAVVFVFAGLNFINSYFNHGFFLLKSMDPVFSEKKLYKRMRTDIGAIEDMIALINNASEKTRYTYLLSSSGILNSDILKNAHLPEVTYATKNLLYTYDVDKRDGFPDAFYTADYVVVPEPVQYHLDPGEQRIVGVLAEAILAGEAGAALQEIAAFSLDDGVTARVYEKKAPYSHAFLKEIDARMKAAYPDHPFINDTASVYAYLYELDMASGKDLYINGKYAFDLAVGEERAGFKLNLEHAFEKVTFTVTAADESAVGKTIRFVNDKKITISETQLILGEKIISIDAGAYENISVEILSDPASGARDSLIGFEVELK